MDVVTWIPMGVGAVCVLGLVYSLVIGSKHPTAAVIALFFSAALCGSSVFATIRWNKDGGEIDTIATAATKLTDAAQVTQSDLANLKSALSALQQQVSLLTVQKQPIGSSSPVGTFSYVVPSTSSWGDIKSSEFCKLYSTSCSNITTTTTGIQVPSATFDDLSKYYSSAFKNDLEKVDKDNLATFDWNSVKAQLSKINASASNLKPNS